MRDLIHTALALLIVVAAMCLWLMTLQIERMHDCGLVEAFVVEGM